ncbi:MAG: HAD family hydrolase, partial [Rubrobacter sp.]
MRQAVVFDCDGLLLDTEECWTRGEMALFAAYGRDFTPDHKRRLLGASGEVSGRILASVLDRPGRERELALELLDFCWGEVVGGAAPRPGAVELVDELRGTVPIGVASNSPRGLVEAALEAVGFDGAFEVVLGVEDVRRPKPDAEIYLAACERLGAAPTRSVALEDSPTGVAAARAAGMYVIGVP